jgi:hypothetical protein
VRLFILICSFVLSSSLYAGAMSDIDLETRESISYYLQRDAFDLIHSIQFAPNQDGCYFTTRALIGELTCFVCFEGEGRSFWATNVSCQ